jgi:hypothetical protein
MATRLDLRKDFKDLYAYVVKRVKSFDPATNDGPGEPGPVTYIEFGFGFEQSGWAALVIDTRPDAEPDGEWNEHIDGNDLNRPRWLAACEANEEMPLELFLPDGTEQVVPAGSGDVFAIALGDLLKSVLLRARADGVFATLPKAPKCELGVEEQEGRYGWPAYKDRRKENLADPPAGRKRGKSSP